MDRLQSMRVFASVVDAGSFVRAADLLDINSAAVTRLIADLENHLGTRLLNRTTRSLSLTEAGSEYLPYCRRIIEELDEAESVIHERAGEVRGVLRMVSGATVGLQLITPHLAEYRRLYPAVTVELHLSDHVPDLVEHAYDLAVVPRQAGLPATLIARQLFQTPVVLCASPDYLRQRGTPKQPTDLLQHDCLNYLHETVRNRWLLHGADGDVNAEIRNILTSNNADALLVAARTGMGVCIAGQQFIEADLRSGVLQRVLPAYHMGMLEIQVAYPSRKFVSAKLRSMIDFLMGLCSPPGRSA